MKKYKRGQLSLINIIFWFILVVMAAVLSPVIGGFLDSYKTNNNISDSSTSGLIVNAIIPIFWLTIIITLILYATPVRPQQY